MFSVGFFQFTPRFGKIKENLERVLAALDDAAADVVVLPELAFTGYYFRDREELAGLAEDPRTSSTVARLTALCAGRRLHLVAGFAEKAGDRLFNSALLIGPEGLRHTYRKIHLFNTEKDCFDPGDTPLAVVAVNGVNLGLMVCFDWVFPEVARTLALLGADILCHPSNLVLTLCQKAMITRSIENGIFTVTANRTGTERRPHGTLKFTGRSQITAPSGKILGRASSRRDCLRVIEIDPLQARIQKITPKNHLLEDRRPEFYWSAGK